MFLSTVVSTWPFGPTRDWLGSGAAMVPALLGQGQTAGTWGPSAAPAAGSEFRDSGAKDAIGGMVSPVVSLSKFAGRRCLGAWRRRSGIGLVEEGAGSCTVLRVVPDGRGRVATGMWGLDKHMVPAQRPARCYHGTN